MNTGYTCVSWWLHEYVHCVCKKSLRISCWCA